MGQGEQIFLPVLEAVVAGGGIDVLCVMVAQRFAPPGSGVAEALLGTGWGWNPLHENPQYVPRAKHSFATYAICA